MDGWVGGWVGGGGSVGVSVGGCRACMSGLVQRVCVPEWVRAYMHGWMGGRL